MSGIATDDGQEKITMHFIFTCPRTHQSFTAERIDIIENHGVHVDAAGNKTLDARVRLVDPCPMCGSRHVFHATELACPFSTDIS